jgi:hypothetical protein
LKIRDYLNEFMPQRKFYQYEDYKYKLRSSNLSISIHSS